MKGTTDPIALPDEDYPPWLWTLLTPSAKNVARHAKKDGRAEAVRMRGEKYEADTERREMRRANRAAIKARNFNATV